MEGQVSLDFNNIFASLNQTFYTQLLQLLTGCLLDSKVLLDVEHKIKTSIQNQGQDKDRILLALTHIFLCHHQDTSIQWISLNITTSSLYHQPQLSYIAGILLKNALKDNIAYLLQNDVQELQLIQQALNSVIQHTDLSFLKKFKKLQKEFYSVVATLVIKLFNQDPNNVELFHQIIESYNRSYNYHILRIIIQVYEEANDDRMWKFIPQILPTTINYLSQVQDNKLLFNVWLMIQNLQWTVGVDQQALNSCLNQQIIQKILEFIMHQAYNVVYYQEGQAYINKATLQQKRYSAKILTLIYREFSTQVGQKLYLESIKEVYQQSMKLLIYYLPFYHSMITFNVNLQDVDKSFDDFEMEFQSLIVQIISLISTLITKKPKQILKDLKQLQQPLVQVMFGYSLIGLEQEKLFTEDQNMFLVAFFEDQEDDMSNLSIRSVVSEVITESLHHQEFDRKLIEQTIAQFFRNELPAQVIESHEKKLYVGSLKMISEINIASDLCIPAQVQVQKQELAMFVMGSQAEYLNINPQVILETLNVISNPGASVILKLRGLWLLEKAAGTYANKKVEAMQVFSTISDYFINSTEFVILFQTLKTLHKYLKIVKVKEDYPDTYVQLLSSFILKTNSLIVMCNDETIHVPIEGLAFFSKIDQESCAATSKEVMPGILEAYKKYHQDGLLGDDIVELIKIWAAVPNNQAFLTVFFPHIYTAVRTFQEYSLTQNTAQTQKMLDQSVIKNMLSILTTYMLANSTLIQHQKGEVYSHLVEIFKMLLDITNSTKEIYTALYTIMCVSAYCQAFPAVAKEYSQVITAVMKKVLTPGSGLEESACLYIGHLLVVMFEHDVVDTDSQQQLLHLTLTRLSKAQLPSTIKSFVLPIALCIVKYGQQMIEFLLSKDDLLRLALTNWVQYQHQFEGEFAKKISKLALIALLDYTTQNLQFASLTIPFSNYSKKETNLQTRLVFVLVKDLIVGQATAKGGAEDADSYGDYGDDDDYGDEDMHPGNKDEFGFDKESFGGDDFGHGVDSSDGENQDEKLLMSYFVQKYNLTQPNTDYLITTFKKVGRQTMSKIIHLEFDEETVFSKKEIETVRDLFM